MASRFYDVWCVAAVDQAFTVIFSDRFVQLIEVEAKLLSMLSRFRSRRMAAYFGSRENFGTESC